MSRILIVEDNPDLAFGLRNNLEIEGHEVDVAEDGESGLDGAVVSRTVDTHVAELRRKIEDDASSPRHILTVRKAGYRLER